MVEAQIWTLIGVLVTTLIGMLVYVGGRIDGLGARLEARIDSLGARLDRRFDVLTSEVLNQSVRIDALSQHRGARRPAC